MCDVRHKPDLRFCIIKILSPDKLFSFLLFSFKSKMSFPEYFSKLFVYITPIQHYITNTAGLDWALTKAINDSFSYLLMRLKKGLETSSKALQLLSESDNSPDEIRPGSPHPRRARNRSAVRCATTLSGWLWGDHSGHSTMTISEVYVISNFMLKIELNIMADDWERTPRHPDRRKRRRSCADFLHISG